MGRLNMKEWISQTIQRKETMDTSLRPVAYSMWP